MKVVFSFFLVFISHFVYAQVITTIVGNGGSGYTGDFGPATNAKLNFPRYICQNISGELLISDFYNNAIRKVNAAGIISTIAGNGMPGYSGDGGQATDAKISGPLGIACDNNGNIYFSEFSNHIIRRINSAGIISTFAGKGTAGYSGDGGQATNAEMYSPYGIAIDKSTNIYFVDNNNYRVRKITPSGIISTIAGTGVPGYSGDGGQATSAKINYFGGIAINNTTKDIYIADYTSHRIRKINTSGIISTFAGDGSIGNSGDGGQATSARLNGPDGVYVDIDGNVYVIDSYANVVRKVNLSGVIITIAGNGTVGYSGDGGPATNAQLSNPGDMFVNASGNVLIAESDNNVIRKITYNNTGIREVISTKNVVSIYPNPVKDYVTIEATSNFIFKEMTITNALGEVVFQQKGNQNKAVANTIKYSSGVYFVKINGTYYGRFVKE